MSDPKPPKLELKMFVLPALLFLTRKLDMKDENMAKMCQGGIIAVATLMLTLYFYVYTRVNSANSSAATKKVFIPPKPKPTLPFGLGPAPEPVKPEEYEEISIQEHEVKMLKEQVQSIFMSIAISLFMSWKFNVHVSLIIQSVMMPLNALDSVVLKKYLLGSKKNADGGDNLYLEEATRPTAAQLAARVPAAAVAAPAAIKEDSKKDEKKTTSAKDLD